MKRSGDLVREQRERLGLTQAELGEKAGVTKQDISAIEKGSKPFGVKKVLKLSEALGASVEPMLEASLSEQLEREGLPGYRVTLKKSGQ